MWGSYAVAPFAFRRKFHIFPEKFIYIKIRIVFPAESIKFPWQIRKCKALFYYMVILPETDKIGDHSESQARVDHHHFRVI